jgi:hypothetical protein
MLLPRLARPLREAGLTRVNIHVDTLHPERIKHLMRFASAPEIEAGITAAVVSDDSWRRQGARDGLAPARASTASATARRA